MTTRPSSVCIGCAAAADKSMMLRRLWPKAALNGSSIQTPSPSGPRWAMAAFIARTASRSRPGATAPLSRSPLIPHIGFSSTEAFVPDATNHDSADAAMLPLGAICTANFLVEPRHGRVVAGADIRATDDTDKSQPNNLQIEPQRTIINVPDVEGEAMLPRYRVAAVDLSPASKARANLITPHLLRRMIGNVFHEQRPGPDQAHLPPDHVPKLRQLVEAHASQPGAKWRHSLTVWCRAIGRT